MRVSGWALVACMMVMTSGCAKKAVKPDEPVATAVEDGGATEAGKATKGAPQGPADVKTFNPQDIRIEVIDPGREPRQKLRYHLKEGQKETMLMGMTMSMNMSMKSPEGEDLPVQKGTIPELEMRMDFTIDKVSKNGDIRSTYLLTGGAFKESAEMSGVGVAQLNSQIGEIVGIGGWSVITDRGVQKELGLQVPPRENRSPLAQQMIDKMRQSMDNGAAPFPEQAIGLGARWKVTMPLKTPEFTGSQTATYTLEELSGDTGRLTTIIEQDIPADQIKLPLPDNGAKVKIERFKAGGTGEVRYNLSHMIPEAILRHTTDIEMTVDVNEETARMRMETGMDVTIKGER